MRKEPLIAIFLGSLIGIGVAFGVWRFSKAERSVQSPSNKTQESNTENQASVSNDFAIVSPNDYAVVDSETVQITGLANSGSTVAALGNEISIGKTNSAGEFSIEVSLSSGINKLPIWSFEAGQSPKKTELTLVYTTQLESPSVGTTSYFGTVTDIAEETLQIRTETGEISQLSIGDATTFVKIIDDTEEIEFSDVAIGDYIAALGEVKNNVMNVGRILVTTQPDSTSAEAAIGIIQTLSSSEFLITTNKDNEQMSIDATGGVSVYSAKEDSITSTRLSNSEEGDEIIIIGEFEDDELAADTIMLL